jgi:hypothetical protein
MITVSFKKNATATAQNFNAVYVEPEYETEDYTFVNANDELVRVILTARKIFNVRFGVLTEAEQDYLAELYKEELPQFIYNGTTYNVIVKRVNAKYRGGSITLINSVAE